MAFVPSSPGTGNFGNIALPFHEHPLLARIAPGSPAVKGARDREKDTRRGEEKTLFTALPHLSAYLPAAAKSSLCYANPRLVSTNHKLFPGCPGAFSLEWKHRVSRRAGATAGAFVWRCSRPLSSPPFELLRGEMKGAQGKGRGCGDARSHTGWKRERPDPITPERRVCPGWERRRAVPQELNPAFCTKKPSPKPQQSLQSTWGCPCSSARLPPALSRLWRSCFQPSLAAWLISTVNLPWARRIPSLLPAAGGRSRAGLANPARWRADSRRSRAARQCQRCRRALSPPWHSAPSLSGLSVPGNPARPMMGG